MPKWTILKISFLWKHHCLCFHYLYYLTNFWSNNWQSIIDIVEKLSLCTKIQVSKVLLYNTYTVFASTIPKQKITEKKIKWNLFHSMTSLLQHRVTQPTKYRFLLNNLIYIGSELVFWFCSLDLKKKLYQSNKSSWNVQCSINLMFLTKKKSE